MKKKLYRSRRDRIIAGVAGGLAEYFEVDPVLVRLIFVVLTFIHGIGVIGYILLWIIVRREPIPFPLSPEVTGEGGDIPGPIPREEKDSGADTKERKKTRFIFGGVLIVIGILFLLDNLLPFLGLGDIWPVLLILLGGGILWHTLSDNPSGGSTHENG
ncbi:MAG: PspC domain-containing protein [Bacteroidota bacterium]|nr:PspC domain-containing protein [Bacteroidota bacterium]